MRSSQQFQDGKKSHVYVSPTFVSSECFYPQLTPPKQTKQEEVQVDVAGMREKYQEIFQKNYRRLNYFPQSSTNLQAPMKTKSPINIQASEKQQTLNNSQVSVKQVIPVDFQTPVKQKSPINQQIPTQQKSPLNPQSNTRPLINSKSLTPAKTIKTQLDVSPTRGINYQRNESIGQNLNTSLILNKVELSVPSNNQAININEYIQDKQQEKNTTNKSLKNKSLHHISMSKNADLQNPDSEIRRFSDYHGFNQKQNLEKSMNNSIHAEEIKTNYDQDVCVNCFNTSLIELKKNKKLQDKKGDQSFIQNTNKIAKFLEQSQQSETLKYKQQEKEHLISEYKKNLEHKKDVKNLVEMEKQAILKQQADEMNKVREAQKADLIEQAKIKDLFFVDLQNQVREKQQMNQKQKLRESRELSNNSLSIGQEYEMAGAKSLIDSNSKGIVMKQREQKLQKLAEEKNQKQKEKDIERKVQQEQQEQDLKQQNMSIIQKRVDQETMQKYIKVKLLENEKLRTQEKQKEKEYYKQVKSQDDKQLAQQNEEKKLVKEKQQILVKGLSIQIEDKREDLKQKKVQEALQDKKLMSKSFDFAVKPVPKIPCDCCKHAVQVDHLTKVKKI